MTAPTLPSLSKIELRQLAEAQQNKKDELSKGIPSYSKLNTKRMLHELQVHKIELEMQNDEIRLARIAERKSSQRYTSLFEFAPIGYFIIAPSGIISELNLRAASLLGAEGSDLAGKYFSTFISPEHRELFKQFLAKTFEVEGIQTCEVMLQVGLRTIWLSVEASVDEHCNDCLAAMIDITHRKTVEEKLKLASSVFTHAREGIFITDAIGTIIDINDTFTSVTGYSREEAVGKNPLIFQSGEESLEFYGEMWEELLDKGFWSGEVLNRRKNSEIYSEMLSLSSVKNASGKISNYVALFTDITLMKEQQSQLEHIAHYDLLTSLPNRVLLSDRISQVMLQSKRYGNSFAVAFLDLDGFKGVNDAYGHDMGDELLIALSIRMKVALREGDSLARIGGDEFVAILADLANVEDCEPVLERLLLAASESVTVNDVIFNISASIGVTFYPQDSADAEQLIRHADQAMYVAKASGKNRYRLFDIAENDAVKIERESLEAIRYALDNQQFVLYYQPKVNMRKGKVTGLEALIRWQHPDRGVLSPMDFLPTIENHAMAIELGEWVINTALGQISQWQATGVNLSLTTSVNIAAVQLQKPEFSTRLASILASHPNVDPNCLELEVLETSALDDVHHVSKIMDDCLALGINFALDDFGTGYSSLTYLRRLPVNVIKIDQSFVQDMLYDGDDLAIVQGVIALAKSFNRKVIAEGVETIQHATALLHLGCDLAQGFGIAKPMPAGEVSAWISNFKPDDKWVI
jgi:diguanylate cyclase (GGDEF)-like protein/PAS domain S-box-containing protein